ncbi:putative membrane protein [Amycolatopsis thermophila]|uniref:Membrane protein n=1 Tax=Amycolatopsis thermophila TaxID=206084 RepID=A0ABU0EZP3_9PSEU|nr:putative membrane protein [Amycolatopsis thermophila]
MTRISAGEAIGSLIAIVFGLVFVFVNSGGLAAPWPLVVRIAGAVVAAVLLVLLLRRGKPEGGAGTTFFDRNRFWVIVAAEVVALFAGLYVINGVLGHGEVGVAWIAVVVGVHFVAMGWAFRLGRFRTLGWTQTALGVAGFALRASGAGAAVIGLVSGVLSGVALFAAALYTLRR